MSKSALPHFRKAIKERFGDEIEMYRAPHGYYYFSGLRGIFLDSIYSFRLDLDDVDFVLHHIQSNLKNIPDAIEAPADQGM